MHMIIKKVEHFESLWVMSIECRACFDFFFSTHIFTSLLFSALTRREFKEDARKTVVRVLIFSGQTASSWLIQNIVTCCFQLRLNIQFIVAVDIKLLETFHTIGYEVPISFQARRPDGTVVYSSLDNIFIL